MKITLFGVLARAFRAWMKYPSLTVLAILAILAQQLFQTYFAYSVKLIIDNVLNKSDDPQITGIMFGLVLAFIIMAIASFGGE